MRHTAIAFVLAFVVCTPLPSAAQDIREWLGVTADVSGQYESLGATDRTRFAVLGGARV